MKFNILNKSNKRKQYWKEYWKEYYALIDIKEAIKDDIKQLEKLNLSKQDLEQLKKELNLIIKKIWKLEKNITKKIVDKMFDDVWYKFPILYSLYGESFILNFKIFKIVEKLKLALYYKLNDLYKQVLDKIETNLKNWNLYTDVILENLSWFLSNIENFNYWKEDLNMYFSYGLINNNAIAKVKLVNEINIEEFKRTTVWKDYWIVKWAFYIYDEAEWTLKLYFNKITIEKLDNFVALIYEILHNPTVKKKQIFFIENKDNFKQIRDYISILQKNNIRILDQLKTLSLKKYFITILSWWLKIWDFDLYLSLNDWKILSWFTQVQQWNWYKIIETWETLNYDEILDDLRILWVELNWLTTLRDINLANWIRFRISIILRNDSFAVSIRKMGEWFENQDFIKNFWFWEELVLKQEDLKLIKVQEKEERLEEINNAWKKNAFFPLESFLNYKEDIQKVKDLYFQTNWAVIVSWTTWHWKSSLLKTLTIDYFNYYFENKNIRKKVLFFEAPIEHLFRDFSQISYNVEKPEQLNDLIISSKTQNPQITVIWETKDPTTMAQLYDLVWLTEAFTTLHKWSVLDVIQYLNEVAKANKTSIISYLYWTNLIITQHMVRDIIKNRVWGLLTERINNLLNEKDFINYYYVNYKLEEDIEEYKNKIKEIYKYTLNSKVETLLLSLLKLPTEENKLDLIILYNKVIKKLEKEDNWNVNKLNDEIEELFENEEFVLYKNNLESLWNTVWIVNEMVDKTAIKNFFTKEWKNEIFSDWNKIFLSLEEDFNENVFSAKLSNEFYKYMWIKNYFSYKYFILFFKWKMSFNWSYSIFFKTELKSQKEKFKKEFINTVLENLKNNTVEFNNIS